MAELSRQVVVDAVKATILARLTDEGVGWDYVRSFVGGEPMRAIGLDPMDEAEWDAYSPEVCRWVAERLVNDELMGRLSEHLTCVPAVTLRVLTEGAQHMALGFDVMAAADRDGTWAMPYLPLVGELPGQRPYEAHCVAVGDVETVPLTIGLVVGGEDDAPDIDAPDDGTFEGMAPEDMELRVMASDAYYLAADGRMLVGSRLEYETSDYDLSLVVHVRESDRLVFDDELATLVDADWAELLVEPD